MAIKFDFLIQNYRSGIMIKKITIVLLFAISLGLLIASYISHENLSKKAELEKQLNLEVQQAQMLEANAVNQINEENRMELRDECQKGLEAYRSLTDKQKDDFSEPNCYID